MSNPETSAKAPYLNVIEFPEEFSCEVQTVLDGVLEADLAKVCVVGVTKDGEFYIASSESFAQTVAHLDMGKAYMYHMLFVEGDADGHRSEA